MTTETVLSWNRSISQRISGSNIETELYLGREGQGEQRLGTDDKGLSVIAQQRQIPQKAVRIKCQVNVRLPTLAD